MERLAEALDHGRAPPARDRRAAPRGTAPRRAPRSAIRCLDLVERGHVEQRAERDDGGRRGDARDDARHREQEGRGAGGARWLIVGPARRGSARRTVHRLDRFLGLARRQGRLLAGLGRTLQVAGRAPSPRAAPGLAMAFWMSASTSGMLVDVLRPPRSRPAGASVTVGSEGKGSSPEHLVEHGAQRVDVRLLIDVAAPSACSGAMNAGVPRIIRSRCRRCPSFDAEVEDLHVQRAVVALTRNRFAGLRSRWITCAAWAAASPGRPGGASRSPPSAAASDAIEPIAELLPGRAAR